MESKKTAAIIQARMGSTRLPGKVMKDLKGKPVLWHVIERVKQSKNIDQIIIATTTAKRDKIIFEKAKEWGVNAYQGSEEDVLARYYEAAKEYGVDTVVRITSDCPLIDPQVIDEVIKFYITNNYDLVTNAGPQMEVRTYPRGLDTEVFSFVMLEKSYNNAKKEYQKEHVTPFIYEKSNNIFYYKNDENYSFYRLTLDEKEDWIFIKKIYDNLYYGEHNFYLKDIINLLKTRPTLTKINNKVKQKNYKK